MNIAYLQKTSLIDYPKKISAILFTQSCNLRCPYCHNPELVKPELFTQTISEDYVLSFLENRRGKLDGLVITGGEPAIQKGLIKFMKQVRDMGFLIKLDTNGTMPDVLDAVINNSLADYIAMDVKAPAGKYPLVSGTSPDMSMILKSIRLIMGSAISYEFRTTWAANQLSANDIGEIAEMIRGAKCFALQRFSPSKHLDSAMLDYASAPAEDEIKKAAEACSSLVNELIIR